MIRIRSRAIWMYKLLRKPVTGSRSRPVKWISETVSKAVVVEFDRYIAAGDLEQTKQRLQRIQEESDESGGFVGMYL